MRASCPAADCHRVRSSRHTDTPAASGWASRQVPDTGAEAEKGGSRRTHWKARGSLRLRAGLGPGSLWPWALHLVGLLCPELLHSKADSPLQDPATCGGPADTLMQGSPPSVRRSGLEIRPH
uniref:Uncharacterized protein n=1 Tax=Rousettus aegyptiacus TaxID=9407 RepID=A0A7J8H1E4_ROUAE|nr:hypothetical protein HJG63_011424 [Rousettus aegyptiacus]